MGKLKRIRKEEGYLLADVLIATLLLCSGIGGLVMSIGTTARLVTRQSDRIIALIEERNNVETSLRTAQTYRK